ncbi:MAG: hypothetical protein Q7J84_03990 [Sulfuricaulis sp.]|nr:hypothetical protein [Sulfuricaulis sp.]
MPPIFDYRRLPIDDARALWGVADEIALLERWQRLLAARGRTMQYAGTNIAPVPSDGATATIIGKRVAVALPTIEVEVFVSDNSWIAVCPACNDGMRMFVGSLLTCCATCGLVYRVKWPSRQELARGVAALLRRPPKNRHWLRQNGETAIDLERENDAHAGEVVP